MTPARATIHAVELADLSRLAGELEGVTERRSGGLLDWPTAAGEWRGNSTMRTW
jgi:hypothetical protein